MQAIVTVYLGPTDHRGARVKATADAGSVIVPWDYAGDAPENHDRAAIALSHKFGWDRKRLYGTLVRGSLPKGGYVYVSTGTRKHSNIVSGGAR